MIQVQSALLHLRLPIQLPQLPALMFPIPGMAHFPLDFPPYPDPGGQSVQPLARPDSCVRFVLQPAGLAKSLGAMP